MKMVDTIEPQPRRRYLPTWARTHNVPASSIKELIAKWRGRAHELGHRRLKHFQNKNYEAGLSCIDELSVLEACSKELEALLPADGDSNG